MEAKGMFYLELEVEIIRPIYINSLLQQFVDEDCSDKGDMVESLPNLPPLSSEPAIMVWEGNVVVSADSCHQLQHGLWREPNGAEWLALREKRNPWESVPGEPMQVKTLDEETLKRALTPPEKPAGIEIEVMQPTKLVVSAIRAVIPRQGRSFLHECLVDVSRESIVLTFDLITKRLREWPVGQFRERMTLDLRPAMSLYILLGAGGDELATFKSEAVPNCLPSSSRFHLDPTFDPDGTILHWDNTAGGAKRTAPWNPNARDIAIDFFGREDD